MLILYSCRVSLYTSYRPTYQQIKDCWALIKAQYKEKVLSKRNLQKWRFNLFILFTASKWQNWKCFLATFVFLEKKGVENGDRSYVIYTAGVWDSCLTKTTPLATSSKLELETTWSFLHFCYKSDLPVVDIKVVISLYF